jgi:hypothetical protein
MYKCSKCNKGVLVVEGNAPVRICECKVEVTLPSGEVIEKNAPIIMELEGRAYGKSQFSV